MIFSIPFMYKKLLLTKIHVALFLFVFINGAFAQTINVNNNVLTEVSPLYVEKLVAAAKANYPRLKSFSHQIEVAKADVNTAKVSWLDPFSFQYVKRSNQQNTNAVDVTTSDILSGYQFGININPGLLFAKPSQVKKAKEQVRVAEANQEEYYLTLESEVKRRYYLYIQYKVSLAPLASALQDAETNIKALRIRYERSEVTLQDLSEATVTYSQAAQVKIQAEAGFLTAKAALEELTVKKLEEIK